MPRRPVGPFDAYVRRSRFKSFLRFVVATATVGVGFYAILHKAAPIVAQAPAPRQATPAAMLAPPPPQVTVARRVVNIETHETRTIYRCTVDGETTYSNEPCPRARVVDTRPAVASYAATPVQRRASPPAVSESPTPVRAAAVTVESPTPARAAEDGQAKRDARCKWLAAAIESIDAQARRALPASEQDRLRESRRKLVDEQYALKC